MIDTVLLLLLLLVDTLGVFFMYKMLQERQKSKIKRLVNKTLQSLGVK